MHWRQRIGIGLLGVLWATLVQAQVLSGVVVMPKGTPIPDAFCKAEDKVAITDSQGRFLFEVLGDLDRVVLVVSHVGCQTTQQKVTLPNRDVVVVLSKVDSKRSQRP